MSKNRKKPTKKKNPDLPKTPNPKPPQNQKIPIDITFSPSAQLLGSVQTQAKYEVVFASRRFPKWI